MGYLFLYDMPFLQTPFWYATYQGETDEVDDDGYKTGEKVIAYSNPIEETARISPNVGQAKDSPFGEDIVYDKSLSTVKNLPIDEYSKLWIDVVPEIDRETGETLTEPDYKVVCAAHDIHRHVWALRRLKGQQ